MHRSARRYEFLCRQLGVFRELLLPGLPDEPPRLDRWRADVSGEPRRPVVIQSECDDSVKVSPTPKRSSGSRCTGRHQRDPRPPRPRCRRQPADLGQLHPRSAPPSHVTRRRPRPPRQPPGARPQRRATPPRHQPGSSSTATHHRPTPHLNQQLDALDHRVGRARAGDRRRAGDLVAGADGAARMLLVASHPATGASLGHPGRPADRPDLP